MWFCGENKLLGRSEASGTNPAKLSLNLLEALFTRDEMAASNINGARGRELLDPIKIKAIQGEACPRDIVASATLSIKSISLCKHIVDLTLLSSLVPSTLR